jgi:hypothetical protein
MAGAWKWLMKLIDLKDLKPEHFKAFSAPATLTAEQQAEAIRLYTSQLSEADLQQYANWDQATSFEDFLRELKEEQRQWDEQSR